MYLIKQYCPSRYQYEATIQNVFEKAFQHDSEKE